MRKFALACTVALALGPIAHAAAPTAATRPSTTATRPSRRAAATQPSAEAQRIGPELQRAGALLDKEDGAKAALEILKQVRTDLLKVDPQSEPRLFRDTAYLWRLAQLLSSTSSEHCQRVRRLAKEFPVATETLVSMLSPSDDHPDKAFVLLDAIATRFPRTTETYANLAAAICVVHDGATTRHVNENAVESPDPLDLFAYYVDSDRRLAISPRNLPPELLVYVVDTTASIDEMNWALKRYQGQRNIGVRFFDIDYDYAHYKSGQEKEVTKRGYTLQNLLKYGGVCADQAYFAATIGKAMGVPAASISGSGAESSHAWVAYLEQRGRDVSWNMESGRYDAYRGVRGDTCDPQTQRTIYEGELRLLADMAGTDPQARLNAIGFADIAGFEALQRINEADGSDGHDSEVRGDNAAGARTQLMPEQEQLLRAAVEANPSCLQAWRQVERLAPGFNARQKADWSGALARLCGRRHPDFAVKVLTPMIRSIKDPAEQDRAWDAAGRLYGSKNADITASILLAQAQLWHDQGNDDLALRKCQSVVQTCADSGPRVVEAVVLAEKVFRSSGREGQLVGLYESAFSRMIPPKDMDGSFARQSSWYQIGMRYIRELDKAGDDQTSSKVRRRLENIAGREGSGQ